MSIAEKLTAIAENEQKVYEAGKQAQYDAFWDAYQQNGSRTNYDTAFAGTGWTAETFRPRYSMAPASAMYMFRRCGITGDLVEILEGFGVELDFSCCNNMTEVFSNSALTRVGVVDISNSVNCNNAFAWAEVKVIDRVILAEDTPLYYFPGAATKLQELRIQGTIGSSGFDAGYCTKLSRDSIISIIQALSDTATGKSITFSLEAVTNAFAQGESLEDSVEWAALLNEKANWTISLV